MLEDPAAEVVRDHLGLSETVATDWADYIAKEIFVYAPDVYDKKNDVESLETLERALRVVVKALSNDSMTVSAMNLLEENLQGIDHDWETVITDSNGTINRTRERVSCQIAFLAIQRNILEIRNAIKKTKKEIWQSKRSRIGVGRLNLQGIQLVESSRAVWKAVTGEDPPPKSLNPSSRYGKFLYDLFAAFEVEGDARSSYRSWAKLHDAARDS